MSASQVEVEPGERPQKKLEWNLCFQKLSVPSSSVQSKLAVVRQAVDVVAPLPATTVVVVVVAVPAGTVPPVLRSVSQLLFEWGPQPEVWELEYEERPVSLFPLAPILGPPPEALQVASHGLDTSVLELHHLKELSRHSSPKQVLCVLSSPQLRCLRVKM